MKKKVLLQKGFTLLMTGALVLMSVPVSAETVSENEAVEVTETEKEETEKTADTDGKPEDNAAYAELDVEESSENDFAYTENTDGTVKISYYYGNDDILVIPSEIKGKKVTAIGCMSSSEEGDPDPRLHAVVIPDTVTEIEDNAFVQCTNLKNVTLSKNLKKIGKYAFFGCPVTKMTIPDSVEEIGGGAFYGTEVFEVGDTSAGKYRTDVNSTVLIEKNTNTLVAASKTVSKVPEGVQAIGAYAFAWNPMSTIDLPDTVTQIGKNAFYNCCNLKNIDLSAVTEIGDQAFCMYDEFADTAVDNVLSSVKLGATKIGDYAFAGTALDSVDLSQVKELGKYVFSDCGKLSSVTWISNVDVVPDGTFSACGSLKEIKGLSAKKVGAAAFSGCEVLQTDVVSKVTEIGACAYRNCGAVKKTIDLSGVTAIGAGAFADCGVLEEVVWPAALTTISASTFSRCNNLKQINIAKVKKVEDEAFINCKNLQLDDLSAIEEIGEYTFEGCNSLTKVNLSSAVKVGTGAFANCNKLSGVTWSAKVSRIEEETFKGCSSIKTFEVSDTVTAIGDRAFRNCAVLEEFSIPGSVSQIGMNILSGCNNLKKITVSEKNKTYSGEGNAIIDISAKTLLQGCGNTVIAKRVEIIGEEAFADLSSLAEITIPDSVKEIKDRAFARSGIQKVCVPASVEQIGSSVFARCGNLKEISVASANKNYYVDADALIERQTGKLIRGTSQTVIPGYVQLIGADAFSGCTGLSRVKIPQGVLRIGVCAFEGCVDLKEIEIPKTISSLRDNDNILAEMGIERDALATGSTGMCVYYAGSEKDWESITSLEEESIFGCDGEDGNDYYATDFKIVYNSTMPDPRPSESPKPSENPKPSESPKPSRSPQPAPSQNPQPSQAPGVRPAGKGSIIRDASGMSYKVVKDDQNAPTVSFAGGSNKRAKTVKIPTTVIIDRVQYRVVEINAKALKNYKKVTSITIPSSVTKIGYCAFEGCSKLKSVTIGKNVTSIGKNAFKNCKSLKKITVKGTKLKKVGKAAFSGIHKNCVIKVPKKKLKSYKSLLKGKGQKKTVKITK